jgi:hypothetical protein
MPYPCGRFMVIRTRRVWWPLVAPFAVFCMRHAATRWIGNAISLANIKTEYR